jgi:hypothetical protein
MGAAERLIRWASDSQTPRNVMKAVAFFSLRQRVVVDSLVVALVAAAAGLETSSPVVSFSIITPCRVAVRRVVVVTSTSCVAGATCVDSVVVLEYDDCANPTPDINVRAVVATSRFFNIIILLHGIFGQRDRSLS